MSNWRVQPKMRLLALAFVVLLGLVSSIQITTAAPNYQINYQGKLTDNTGATVADGTYNIEFKLYTAPSGGGEVWTETASTTVINGLFSYMLGSTSALTGVDFNQTLYLGVNVGGTGSPSWDGEMSPRKILGTVPAAFIAQTALDSNTVGGVASTSFLRNDQAGTTSANSSATLFSIAQSGTGNLLDLWAGATKYFTVLGNGNVGIGTSSPARNLTIDGELQITGGLYDNNNTRGANNMILRSTGAGLEWIATSSLGFVDNSDLANYLPLTGGTLSGNLTFSGTAANIALGSNWLSGDGDDEGISVGSTGRVFIENTTSYSADDLLTITNQGGYTAMSINSHGSVSYEASTLNFRRGRGTVASPSAVQNGDLIMQLHTVGRGSSAWTNMGDFTLSVDGAPSGNNIPSRFTFFTTDSSGVQSEVMRINSQSRVGIGTTTPTQTLTVDGGVRFSGALYDNANSAGTNGMVLQSTATGFEWVATGTLGFGSGTVTSVDLSVPTGFTVSGNPVTTSGTLALAYAAGYEGLLTASSTNWNSFYNTPSTRITDGTGLTWSGNTLNLDNDFGATIDESELNIAAAPTNGYVLQASSTSAGGFAWVATSTLGINSSLFTDGGATTYLTSSDNFGIGSTSANTLLTIEAAEDTALIALGDSTNSDQVNLYTGTTSPEGRVTAPIGSLFMDSQNGALYQKTGDDNGNTSWGVFSVGTSTHMAQLVRATATTAPSITSPDQSMDFDTVTFDQGGLADTSLDRITIKRSGKYLVQSFMQLQGLDASERLETLIFKNDVDIVGSNRSYSPAANQGVTSLIANVIDLVAGDYITFKFTHNEGGDLTTPTTIGTRPTLTVTEVGRVQNTGGNSLFTDGGADSYLTDEADNLLIGTSTNSALAKFVVRQQNASDIVNIFDGSTEVFTILDGGNVGIGTSTPTHLFSVAGDLHATGALYDNANSAGTNGMVLQTTGTGFNWVSTSSLNISAGASTLDALTDVDTTGVTTGNILAYTGAGWVDFATSTFLMESELDIEAELEALLGDVTNVFTSNTDDISSAELITAVSDETGSGVLVFGTSPIFTTNITTPLILGGTGITQDLTFQTTSGVGATGADMHFLVGNNGATEAITILNNGNVGIGSSTPNQKLVIQGSVSKVANNVINTLNTGYAEFGSVNNNGAYGALSVYGSNFGTVAIRNDVVLGAQNSIYISTDMDVGTGGTNDIIFATGGSDYATTQRMIITSAGRLGLNDATPDYGFEVNISNGNGYFGITNSTDGDIFEIDSIGRVGIATSTPTHLLSVAGDAYVSGALYDNANSAGTNGMVLQTTGTGFNWVSTSSLNISAGASTLDALTDVDTTGVTTGNILAYTGAGWVDFATSTFLMESELNTEAELEALLSGLDVVTISTDDITSANLATALSNETGTGNVVFSDAPTLTGIADFVSGDFSSTLTMSGSAANIALGSNFLSGDGNDEGIYIDSSGNVGIGTTTPESLLAIGKVGITGNTTAGINEYFGLSNATLNAIIYGDRTYIKNNSTATSSIIGGIIRIEDSTGLGNTVRGFEVQAHRGTSTFGENTALSGFARTFGVRGTTEGDAGGVYEPAGGFFQTRGTTQGNALRGYSASITTAELMSLFQDTSDFEGTGLLMDFGNGSGSFASTSSKFVDLQNAGTSKFVVYQDGTATIVGTTTIGASTTATMAGLQVGNGGICVDNDGSCKASVAGRIASVSTFTGNSDLAEMYFSSDDLLPGEIVVADDFISVKRATSNSNKTILGVVSTKPGLLLGSDDVSLKTGQKGYPLALSGRVPVRLSNENGDIKAGDPLTLSSLPGIAMKATEADVIVGYAIEDFNGTYAYTEGYINQFGDDIAKPDYTIAESLKSNKKKADCYYGGGDATGEITAPCDPEDVVEDMAVSGPTDAEIAEARFAAEQAALQALRDEPAETVAIDSENNVKVGSVTMFVYRGYHFSSEQIDILNELTSTSTDLVLGAETDSGETLWSRLKLLAQNFVDGVLTIAGIKTDKLETSELCVDDVCIDAAGLKALLQASNNNGQIIQVLPAADADDGEVTVGETVTTGSTSTTSDATATSSEEVVEEEIIEEETASSTPEAPAPESAEPEVPADSGAAEPELEPEVIEPVVQAETVEPEPEPETAVTPEPQPQPAPAPTT